VWLAAARHGAVLHREVIAPRALRRNASPRRSSREVIGAIRRAGCWHEADPARIGGWHEAGREL
jgi:hypothetical protein